MSPLEATPKLSSSPTDILQVVILKFVFEITAWTTKIETSQKHC